MAQYLPGVGFVLGLWLLVAPYVLGFTEQTYAFWNSLVVGAVSTLAGILAGYQLVASHRQASLSAPTAPPLAKGTLLVPFVAPAMYGPDPRSAWRSAAPAGTRNTDWRIHLGDGKPGLD